MGTFVLDALGQRWACDLGGDDYNFPGYFGGGRWNYYRLRAEGHNTLVIDPDTHPDQDPRAATRIVRFDTKPASAFAIADLSSAYAQRATKVERGIALLDRKQVLIEDEITATKPSTLWWFMHTEAEIQPDAAGKVATLTRGGARLHAQILSPPDARFAVMPAAPLATSPHPEKQGDNKNTRKLAINVSNATAVRIVVWFVPLKDGEAAPTKLPVAKPLSDW